jgi:hypothetical protein
MHNWRHMRCFEVSIEIRVALEGCSRALWKAALIPILVYLGIILHLFDGRDPAADHWKFIARQLLRCRGIKSDIVPAWLSRVAL